MSNNIIQLIADIWDEAQVTNRPMTIRKFKATFERVAREHVIVTRTPMLEGVPHQSLLRLRADIMRVFNLKESEFCSSIRKLEYVYPRHIFNLMAREHQISSFQHIATLSCHKDHTTVISSVKRAKNLIATQDPLFIKYWHAYLRKGDSCFTGICKPQVTLDVIERKKPTVYSNTTPYGIAWRTDI